MRLERVEAQIVILDRIHTSILDKLDRGYVIMGPKELSASQICALRGCTNGRCRVAVLVLFCTCYCRDVLVGSICRHSKRAAFGNVSGEDRVVVRLDKKNVIKGEQEYGHVRIGAVEIWYWNPGPRPTACDRKGGSPE